ncbi:MAG: hypothetical protein E6R07_01025 [Nevskiaceae bacterium]|nr:MAG: hypothetical protein E6R07_01025 [Nevskiaceae bacterium]
MSSNSFAGTVDLTLRPSMRAFKGLFWLHVLPIALLPFAMEPGPAMWLLLVLFGASWLGLRRHPVFGFGPRALNRLLWHGDNATEPAAGAAWVVYDAAGAHEAELLGSSTVHPRILILNFRLKTGGRRSRVLLGDEADPELLRRLRARLLLLRGQTG